jgi:hypothetical protein
VQRSSHALRVLPGGLEEAYRVGRAPPGLGAPSSLAPSPATIKRRRQELFAFGIDEANQGPWKGDPWGSLQAVGLRVPTAATPGYNFRYLFNLASFQLADGQKALIRGYRLFWTLGAKVSNRVVEQPVTTPFFKLPDGNVSFHLFKFGSGSFGVPGQPPLTNIVTPSQRSSAKWWADTPAILYDSYAKTPDQFYVNNTGYQPPNIARPWGRPAVAGLGYLYGSYTPFETFGAWQALDVPVEGAGRYWLAASVAQTSPEDRPALSIVTVAPFPLGLSPEEQFLKNFDGAVIWRVGGSLVVDIDERECEP